MTTKTNVRAETKKLKAKLESIQDDLHDLMLEFSNLDYDVEIHMVIEGHHYRTDILRLYKEADFED